MNRPEERLVWACALDLFAVPVLEAFVLESINHIQLDLAECDIPRLASPEGMAEVAGMILADIKGGKRPLTYDVRRLNREHLQALKFLRFLIAGEVLRRVPKDELPPRLSEIKLQCDVGL